MARTLRALARSLAARDLWSVTASSTSPIADMLGRLAPTEETSVQNSHSVGEGSLNSMQHSMHDCSMSPHDPDTGSASYTSGENRDYYIRALECPSAGIAAYLAYLPTITTHLSQTQLTLSPCPQVRPTHTVYGGEAPVVKTVPLCSTISPCILHPSLHHSAYRPNHAGCGEGQHFAFRPTHAFYGGEINEVIRFFRSGKQAHTRKRCQHEVCFRLHNVCGWRDDIFRKSYLRYTRADILAILETNCCSTEEEATWAGDWPGQAFWASQHRDPDSQPLGSHRGVAIFVRLGGEFGRGKVIARDPEGRYLAVHLTIHHRPTLIVAFHADCGTDQAESYARAQAAITIPPGTLDVHLLADTNNRPSALDYCRMNAFNPLDSQDMPTSPPHHLAALHSLTQHLGGLRDAFRSLHPDSREYTHCHRERREVISKARIDRHYLSPHLISHSAPHLVAVTHLSPSSEQLRRMRGVVSHIEQCSDHAAVDTTIAYTDTALPPRQWHLPLHVLSDHVAVGKIRAATAASLDRNTKLRPTLRLRAWLADIRRMISTQMREEQKQHTIGKQKLNRALVQCEKSLGLGVGPECYIASVPTAQRTARRKELEAEHTRLIEQVDDVRKAEDRRWLLDHDYHKDVKDESCTRAFFERKRAIEREDSHITKVRTVKPSANPACRDTVNTYCGQKEVQLAADRFYGHVRGGLFNLPFTPDLVAEQALHDALRRDGKFLPAEHSERLSSFGNIVNVRTVKAAITGMAKGKTPGVDGYPIEFFALFVVKPRQGSGEESDPEKSDPKSAEQAAADTVIQLLVDCYDECFNSRAMPADWNQSVTSLLHKKDARDVLTNYRPISVCTNIYKILARCLADALQTALPWLVDPAQVASQEGKSCFSNTRYIQDLITYCDNEQQPGVLLFADAAKAFDRVQHTYIISTLKAMNIPPAFSRLYQVLLTGATTRIKVNGFLGHSIALRNSVRQGDPCSPLIFILTLQPLLSMYRLATQSSIRVPTADGTFRDCYLAGIPIPNLDGTGNTCEPTASMADDIALAIRDTDQLPCVQLILQVHERASGALNNWDKTYGLRIGTLRGTSHIPAGWNPNHIDFTEDPIRYLGIFLGTPDKVARKIVGDMQEAAWRAGKSLTAKVGRRFEEWAEIGVASTYAGRNLIVKNSVLAMVWYTVESQSIAELDSALTEWQRMAWRFVEASTTALRTEATTTLPTAHRVARLVLAQDYAEGGRRCVDVELFSRALQMRAIRGLLEPGLHPYRNLPYHWLRSTYARLGHTSHTILLSNCTFHTLPDTIPTFWRQALLNWGTTGGGLQPSHNLTHIQTGRQPECDLTDDKSAAMLCRPPLTYQQVRPLPPFNDGLWHRSSQPRLTTDAQTFTLAAGLSLPLAYNPLIGGFLGAPVRDTPTNVLADARRRGATKVRIANVMSPEIRAAASDLHIRLDRLASRGITHVVHLTVGPSPDVTFRLKTWAEISNTGAPNRNRRLPRWICEELLASIPPNIRIAVDEASSLHARSPRLTLQDLCRASFYPPDTWVALSSGIVAAVMESRTTDLVIHAHHVQRPDGHHSDTPVDSFWPPHPYCRTTLCSP